MSVSSAKITFVLPLKINANQLGSDLDRVKCILLPSLVKYFKISDIDRFYVIVPDSEQAQVAEELSAFKKQMPLTVMPEGELLASVPGWVKHQRVHQSLALLKGVDAKLLQGRLFRRLKLNNGWTNLGGWLKQQWLKLCAARLVKTDFYMTLDADLCLTHPADFTSLVPDGRAIMETDAAGTHYDWWTGAAKALNLPLKLAKTDLVLSVTPELMSTAVVRHLLDHLYGQAKKQGYLTVFEYISANRGWTEYTLYWLFLLEFYKPEDYYTNIKTKYQLHSDDSVWDRKKAPDAASLKTHVDAAFSEGQAAALFLVIQSTCISLEEYHAAIKGYLL